MIEAQFAHVEENRVRAAYNHARYFEERRDLMQDRVDCVDAVRQSCKVISYREKQAKSAGENLVDFVNYVITL